VGLTFFIFWIAAINLRLSTGLTDMALATVTAYADDLLAFFRTIRDDSEISADAAPLRLALALDAAESGVGLELEEIWFTAFLSKQLLM